MTQAVCVRAVFPNVKKTTGQLNFVIVFLEFTFDFCHNIILKEKKKGKKEETISLLV